MRYASFVSVALKRSQHEALTAAISRMPTPVPIDPRVNKVVLKPSIYDPNLVGNTTFGMAKAVTEFFRSVAPVVIVESDNPRRTAEEAFAQSGYNALATESVSLVNLSDCPLTEVDFAGTFLRKVDMRVLGSVQGSRISSDFYPCVIRPSTTNILTKLSLMS